MALASPHGYESASQILRYAKTPCLTSDGKVNAAWLIHANRDAVVDVANGVVILNFYKMLHELGLDLVPGPDAMSGVVSQNVEDTVEHLLSRQQELLVAKEMLELRNPSNL